MIYDIDRFTSIAASVFNNLTYFLTYLLFLMFSIISQPICFNNSAVVEVARPNVAGPRKSGGAPGRRSDSGDGVGREASSGRVATHHPAPGEATAGRATSHGRAETPTRHRDDDHRRRADERDEDGTILVETGTSTTGKTAHTRLPSVGFRS